MRQVLTARGQLVALAAVALYLLGWGFGTREAYPLALGLGLACVLAAGWTRLLARPGAVSRRLPPEPHECEPVPVTVGVHPSRPPVPTRAPVVEGPESLRAPPCPVVRQRQELVGRYHVP